MEKQDEQTDVSASGSSSVRYMYPRTRRGNIFRIFLPSFLPSSLPFFEGMSYDLAEGKMDRLVEGNRTAGNDLITKFFSPLKPLIIVVVFWGETLV